MIAMRWLVLGSSGIFRDALAFADRRGGEKTERLGLSDMISTELD
jgi:hypothetical protein